MGLYLTSGIVQHYTQESVPLPLCGGCLCWKTGARLVDLPGDCTHGAVPIGSQSLLMPWIAVIVPRCYLVMEGHHQMEMELVTSCMQRSCSVAESRLWILTGH